MLPTPGGPWYGETNLAVLTAFEIKVPWIDTRALLIIKLATKFPVSPVALTFFAIRSILSQAYLLGPPIRILSPLSVKFLSASIVISAPLILKCPLSPLELIII